MAMLGVGHADELVVDFLQTPLPKGTVLHVSYVLHRALYHFRRSKELNGHLISADQVHSSNCSRSHLTSRKQSGASEAQKPFSRRRLVAEAPLQVWGIPR
jgi:hypothetical protein